MSLYSSLLLLLLLWSVEVFDFHFWVEKPEAIAVVKLSNKLVTENRS